MHAKSHIDDQVIAEDIEIPDDMLSYLRSDHAGETGAVYIDRGIRLAAKPETMFW